MGRDSLTKAKRVVVKIGSSSLSHKESSELDYRKLEHLVRVLSDLRNSGKEVVLVTSGAQMVGKTTMRLPKVPTEMPRKQALSAIGQANLMMHYQRLFSEYNQVCAQILLTKHTLQVPKELTNAQNTFHELLRMGVIPIVNENDTISTDEIEFGDNDTLSAYVLTIIDADLLIILSDIDGFYTDDPTRNPDATLMPEIAVIEDFHFSMGKDFSSSGVGSGGMNTKLKAAKIATEKGADMVLINGNNMDNIYHVLDGDCVGTHFSANPIDQFNLLAYLNGGANHE